MLSDRTASELISQSLQRKLTDEEQREIDENLARSEASRGFQRLSQAIHNSVADVARLAEEGDESIAPGLSADAKVRLRDSIRQARQHSGESRADAVPGAPAMASGNPLVAESDLGIAVSGPKPGESRQVTSRFTLIRRLGDGGLGTVWLARDEKLKRNVAIKQMNPAVLESPHSWERFHREAEITGKLEHPNVVPMYQFGTDSKTGQPFYAMRFLGKQTLADAVIEHHERRIEGDDDPMGLHRMLTAFLDVCQAIAYAHSRGVIHRDLKPENVALDHFGQVIVLDWGLAKLVEDGELSTEWTLRSRTPDDGTLRTTMIGDIVGTPLYMSPEQASGELDDIDERTDVYGLGAILFAILTGSAPHENSCSSLGGTVRVEELLKAISERDTPSAIELNPAVSREMAEICRRAMSRRKSARRRRIRTCRRHRTLDGRPERTPKSVQRNPDGRTGGPLRAGVHRSHPLNQRPLHVRPAADSGHHQRGTSQRGRRYRHLARATGHDLQRTGPGERRFRRRHLQPGCRRRGPSIRARAAAQHR
ncbi:MAG: serine/threonine-protein kinase [Planctomycetaceae bacterium]